MSLLTPTPEEFCAADMNNDGTIDTGDVVLILQKAVGIIPAAPADGVVPHLWARSGSELGEVIFNVANLAGLEVEMTFDPSAMSFVEASAPGLGALTLVNDKTPGLVQLGFAKATMVEGDILLRFDVVDASSPLTLKSVTAFDEYGAKQENVELGPTEILFGVTSVDLPAVAMQWLGAVPNPFNPQTELRFRLAEPGDATLVIYDAAGRAVRTLRMSGLSAGDNAISWDGTDDAGSQVASGGYLIRLSANGRTDTGRVVLLK